MSKMWINILILSSITYMALAKCAISGRFLNQEVPGCQNYIMCLQASGGFIQYNLTCPLNFAFDPLGKVCTNVTSFHCPDQKVSFNCSTVGTFENSFDKGCSSYIMCSQSYDGSIEPIVLTCSDGTLFNPTLSECVNSIEYECPSSVSSTEPGIIEVNDEDEPTNPTHTSGSKRIIAVNFLILFVITLVFKCLH